MLASSPPLPARRSLVCCRRALLDVERDKREEGQATEPRLSVLSPRLPRSRQQAQAPRPEPLHLPPDGRGRGRRYLAAPPRPARLLEVVPVGDQGRRPRRRGGADRARRRAREPEEDPGSDREAVHSAGVSAPLSVTDVPG